MASKKLLIFVLVQTKIKHGILLVDYQVAN